jgi:hypothetical protein
VDFNEKVIFEPCFMMFMFPLCDALDLGDSVRARAKTLNWFFVVRCCRRPGLTRRPTSFIVSDLSRRPTHVF